MKVEVEKISYLLLELTKMRTIQGLKKRRNNLTNM